MNDDAELLRRYAEEGANDAFAELVRRHVNLVYSAALRQLSGDAHLAADATQLVFTDLARKAGSLRGHRVLAGWLFTSTRFATAKLVRGERRRQARETEARLMQASEPEDFTAHLDWQQVRPVLDDVMGQLNDRDRQAILLRFFEGRDYAGVGAQLNLSDNTARMRVERALDKLRALLERRGVRSTSAALAVALGNQAVAAAPAGLAAAVAGAVVAGGTAGGIAAAGTVGTGGAAAWIKFMSMTKLQLGLSGALVVAGAAGVFTAVDSNATLRQEVARLREESAAVPALRAENLRLGRLAVEVEEMRGDDARFVQLQHEAGALKGRLQEVAAAEKARQVRRVQSSAVLDISQLDQTPVPRFQARPQYPFEMRRAGIGGEVVVEFVVDQAGEVQKPRAIRSSRPEFEAAAVQAVSKWKFKPGRKGGQDVNTRMQVPVVFTVEGQASRPTAPSAAPETPPPEQGQASATVRLQDFHVVATGSNPAVAGQPKPRE